MNALAASAITIGVGTAIHGAGLDLLNLTLPGFFGGLYAGINYPRPNKNN